jgi:hypothetical protein
LFHDVYAFEVFAGRDFELMKHGLASQRQIKQRQQPKGLFVRIYGGCRRKGMGDIESNAFPDRQSESLFHETMANGGKGIMSKQNNS